ncbi:MAG: beta-lactamase family protein [Oscillospiraceae bacterium]|nr:beta-lactamase family protein [Oscillospiraceae bacterium]
MPTKVIAFVLSFLSIFMFWNSAAQPNRIPETRSYLGEVPDKYGVWPTEEFEVTDAFPPLLGAVLENLYKVKGLTGNGSHNDSMLVLHKGVIVYETYAEGWDEDIPHPMYSVTKSVMSALVGIAIAEGKIEGLGQKVVDFYPEAPSKPGWQESKADMTVGHLITMTSGLPGDGDEGDWDLWAKAPDSGLAAFLTPQKAAPGTQYNYSSGSNCQTLAGLLTRAVGMNLFEYAKLKLFGPIGMEPTAWMAADDGVNAGGFGLEMTSRDMARLGYLYLNYGRWENQQIIPAEWVVQTPPKSMSRKSYGHMWWNYPYQPFNGSFEANGLFGQYIAVLPEWDTVIVRTGSQGPIDEFVADLGRKLGLMPY